ncbi:SEL1-like repeat protein [Pseudomonas sp. TCU-HL1]|uniref:SEL1-like repeat protein n=1 Tax=Pseudomonas sp. TCU-HL1 TaxID=1856685 RepID=UPI00083DEA17|nr:SEL1-like repeat protein [Pseudomonas sp. TCU-HL1]AOE86349.1 alginate biosynthesis protein [Pseudomonas sp. TCU-HL1]
MRAAFLSLLGGGLLLGCAGLPDQQLAREALLRGDDETARQNFQALAGMGYPEAQTALGDMAVGSRDPSRLAEAESLYRQAASSSVRAQSRLGRLLSRQGGASDIQLKEAEGLLDQAISRGEYSAVVPLTLLYLSYPQLSPALDPQQLVNGWRTQGIAEAELAQILIYRSQGSYTAHLGEVEAKCQALLQLQDICYVELATVHRLRQQPEAMQLLLANLRSAYASGVVAPARLESVALTLADPAIPAPAELSQAKGLLDEVAPVYPGAWASLAKLLHDYPALGSPEEMLGYLERGRAAGDSRAELLTGRLYYDGRVLPQDPRLAEEHLLKAAAEQPAAHFYLGQLYRRGYLGEVRPQEATDHLLQAARAGHTRADLALALLFSESLGVKVDRVNAYVFACLAAGQAQPEATALLANLEPAMSAAERQRAAQLLQDEQGTRHMDPARLVRIQPLQNGMDLL